MARPVPALLEGALLRHRLRPVRQRELRQLRADSRQHLAPRQARDQVGQGEPATVRLLAEQLVQLGADEEDRGRDEDVERQQQERGEDADGRLEARDVRDPQAEQLGRDDCSEQPVETARRCA